MTEFKRTAEELASLEELLSSLADDASTPAPERLVTFSAAKVSSKDAYTLLYWSRLMYARTLRIWKHGKKYL